MYLDQIEKLLKSCTHFLCIGTSGAVYPAAGFVQLVPFNCKKLEFNLESTSISSLFDESIVGPAGETLPTWVDQLLSKD